MILENPSAPKYPILRMISTHSIKYVAVKFVFTVTANFLYMRPKYLSYKLSNNACKKMYQWMKTARTSWKLCSLFMCLPDCSSLGEYIFMEIMDCPVYGYRCWP